MKRVARTVRSPALARLLQRWQALPARQRVLAATAAGLLAMASVGWLALEPALTLMRSSSNHHQVLDAQLQTMERLQAQARAMQAAAHALPALGRDEARHALETAVRQHLGDTARLTTRGEGATLVLTGASGDSLAQWLIQARIEARTLPTEAHLNRAANGLWEGQLTLALPGR